MVNPDIGTHNYPRILRVGTRGAINEHTGMNDVKCQYSEHLASVNVPFRINLATTVGEMPTMYATGAFLEVVTCHSGLVSYGGGDDALILTRQRQGHRLAC